MLVPDRSALNLVIMRGMVYAMMVVVDLAFRSVRWGPTALIAATGQL